MRRAKKRKREKPIMIELDANAQQRLLHDAKGRVERDVDYVCSSMLAGSLRQRLGYAVAIVFIPMWHALRRRLGWVRVARKGKAQE